MTAMMAYPFPLRDGTLGKLDLPASGLDPRDAERLIEFVRSITIPHNEDADSEAGS